MKGLYKRGKTYWMCYKSNGRICRESTKEKLEEDAMLVLAHRRKQVRNGEIIEDRKRRNNKFAELSQDYLRWAERQKSYKDKRLLVIQLLKRFGNIKVNELNTKILEQWQSECLKYNKPATVNRKLSCLKHMIKKGVQWDMVSEATLKKVQNVKLLEENNTRLRFLSVEECRELVDCCADHLRPIVITALHTGMRASEIFGLRWEQVDLRHGLILLDITKNGERREIPIDNTLQEMFNSMPHSIESIYVFNDPKTGDPYKSVKRSFSTALRKADIRDFRFHDLRHTFASQLVMAGVDLASIKELLGHKTLTMTMRYAHLAPEHKRKAVNKLDEVLMKTRNQNVYKQVQVHNFGSQFEFQAEDASVSPYISTMRP